MIEGVVVTPLKQYFDERGKVMHMMRSDSPIFDAFGEIYFSWVEKNAVKAWKKHTRMSMNLVVPVGLVRFVFYNEINQKLSFLKAQHLLKAHY